jgi:hypothetical protein
MTHLRTDLPLLPDQEMDDWVEDIVENTHYRDIRSLHLKLKEALESQDGDMTHATITKKCNKCDRTYPEHTDTGECGNTNLEPF